MYQNGGVPSPAMQQAYQQPPQGMPGPGQQVRFETVPTKLDPE